MINLQNIYVNDQTMQFIVVPDDFETEQSLGEQGYYCFSANAKSVLHAKKMMREDAPEYSYLKLSVIPISINEAEKIVRKYHRHIKTVSGHKFSLGVTDGKTLVGVLVASRPKGRFKLSDNILEVNRLCILPGFKNACSLLLSRVVTIAKSMGYKKVITYLLDSESGSSLKASGWEFETMTKGGSWNSPSRQRIDKAPTCPKQRWCRECG